MEILAQPARPVPTAIDNQGGLAIARKNGPTKRFKYIDVRHQLLQQLTTSKQVTPYFKRSVHVTTDIMTKPLKPAAYLAHRRNLRIIQLSKSSTPALGGIVRSSGLPKTNRVFGEEPDTLINSPWLTIGGG